MLLIWRRRSPGISLHALEWGFFGGSLVAIMRTLRAGLKARTGPAGSWARSGPLLTLWLWHAASHALLTWLASHLRLIA